MEFVSFEIAKKLKDLGFDEPFVFFYREDDEDKCVHIVNINKPIIYCDKIDDEVIIAPTISQVLKWLRKEKLILIGLSPMQEYGGDEVVEWCANIYKTDNKGGLSWQEELYYQSYELAALAGIEYALDNLI